MKIDRKRRIYNWAMEYVTSSNVRIAVLAVPLLLMFFQQITSGTFKFSEFFDVSILVSFVLIVLSDIIAKRILSFIQSKCEDSAKLTTEYAALSKKYATSNLLKYENNGKLFSFPIVCLFFRKAGETITIDDRPKNYFKLPKQIEKYSAELMTVHEKSVLYNQICIRLDGIDILDHEVVLKTSRTYYFDSMITNRACDYLLKDKRTIREIFEPGPFIQELENSKMSNHLGFNGFICTKDGKIPFIYRSSNLSIGKNTLATSIGASLKAKYALSDVNAHEFTTYGLGNAIIKEIEAELGLEKLDVDSSSAVNSIIAFYRDLVECGKPQFLFYLQLEQVTSQEIEASFNLKNKVTSVEDKVKKDGKKVIFFSIEDLLTAIIEPDKLIVAGKSYPVMPSVAASIVMLVDYLYKST